jgi:hypothetical protein
MKHNERQGRKNSGHDARGSGQQSEKLPFLHYNTI